MENDMFNLLNSNGRFVQPHVRWPEALARRVLSDLERGMSLFRTTLLGSLILLAAALGRADTACLDFSATPDTYTAPAGATFTVITTYTNCGTDTTIFIGGGFGSDQSVHISQIEFADPFFILGPGDTATAAFADYTWDPSAPAGFVWNPTINAEYVVAAGICTGFECDFVGGGFAFSDFTATVAQPVPEPATLLLLSTGAAGIFLRVRRRRPRARS
jgi:hypothetical protein